jgi:hypothetical protein
MPTPLEMFDALREATKGLPPGETFRIHLFDGLKLGKLTVEDLVSRGLGVEVAEAIIGDFRQGSLKELGNAVGVDLDIDRVPDLIGEDGVRQGPGIVEDEDGQTLEEIFEELDRIRHPERYPA